MEFPSEVVLRPGEEGEISLLGAGSAGYVWIAHVEGPKRVVSFRIGPSAPPQHVEPGSIPNAGSIGQTLMLHGLAPGRVKLHLELRRPWESDRPPRIAHTLEIRVI